MRIAIVGNAQLARDYSHRIDTADQVVRFNRIQTYGGNGGTHTTVLCLTNWGEIGRKFARRRIIAGLPCSSAVEEFWIARPTLAGKTSSFLVCRHWRADFRVLDYSAALIARNDLGNKPCVHLGLSVYEAALERCGLPRSADSAQVQPSTGLLAIVYALQRYRGLAELELFGFRFTGWAGHPWAAERSVVEALQCEGRLTWVRD